MNLNQSIGRTFDFISIAKGPQQATNQGGLASAKVTFEGNHQAGMESWRKRSAKGERGRLVLERQHYGLSFLGKRRG